MPIYIKSRQVQGVNYVFHNGESYKRTGITKPLSATHPLSADEYTKLFVDSCSGAAMGETSIPVGGTTDIDTSVAGEFQLKFEGTNVGDQSELIFRNGTDTCTMVLSVSAADGVIWDATGEGTPGPYEIKQSMIPHTFAYEDCNANRYDVTLAGLGSYIFKTKRTKLALGKQAALIYSALSSADGKLGSIFTDANNIDFDNIGTEALNIGSTDPQNYVAYTIYHTANAQISFDISNPDAITQEMQAPGALSAHFETNADGDVQTMHLGLSGTPIVYARDTLKCGDSVIGEDADGTEVVLEYRETTVSDKVGIDFPTNKSTFYVYRNDLSIKKHNTSCSDDPWQPGPVVPDPVDPGDPIEYTPVPIPPVVYNATYTVTTGSPAQYDVVEGKDLGVHATQYLTAGDLLEINMSGSTYGAHPLTIGTLESGSFVELTETAKHGLNDMASITYNKEELNNGGGVVPNDWVITFGSMSEGTYYYRCNIHPAMSGEIVVAPWAERFVDGSAG